MSKQNVPLSEVMTELRAPDAGQTMEQVKTSYHTAVRVQVERNLSLIQTNVLAEMEMTGEDAYYYWTVAQKNKETGKIERVPITGPSIDGAMILVRNWGNCAVEIDVCQEDRQSWTFRAVFVDLQTGFTSPRLFRQRKTESHGKYDEDRKLDIAFQIGQSKAIRNTITKVMPAGLMRIAMERAREAAASKYKDLGKYVPAFIRKFTKMNVTVAQLEGKLEKLQAEWTAMDLATLEAIGRSIKDGETTVDDEFGDLVQTTETPVQTQTASSQAQAAPAQAQTAPAAAGPPSKDIPIDDLVKQAMAGVQETGNPNDLPASWGGDAKPQAPAVQKPAVSKMPPGEPVPLGLRVPDPVTPPPTAPVTGSPAPAAGSQPAASGLMALTPSPLRAAPTQVAAPAPVVAPVTPPAPPTPVAPVAPAPVEPAKIEPAAVPVQEQPVLVEPEPAPLAPGEMPMWALTIMGAPNLRAMNAAIMAAVKAGVPKPQIDPFAAKRRSEIDAASKAGGPT